jgi:hypothetical protein
MFDGWILIVKFAFETVSCDISLGLFLHKKFLPVSFRKCNISDVLTGGARVVVREMNSYDAFIPRLSGVT